MEVVEDQREGFITDAQLYIEWLAEDVSDEIMEECLGIISTYLSTPEVVKNDERVIVSVFELAKHLFLYLTPLGRWDEISALWSEMIPTLERIDIPLLKAEIITQLAVIKNNQGAVDQATALYEQLLDSSDFEQLTHEQRLTVFHHMGVCYVRQGNYRAAKQVLNFCIDRSLPIDQSSSAKVTRSVMFSAPDWEIQAYARNQLGNIAMAMGSPQEAHQAYQESLQLFIAQAEKDNLACVAYQSLGRLHIRQREFHRAIPYLEHGLDIRRQRGEHDAIASNGVQLAEAYVGVGRLTDAELILNEVMRIYDEVDEPNGKALCHYVFGQLELRNGNRADAILQWQAALNILSDTQMPPIELQILVSLLPQLLFARQIRRLVPTTKRFFQNLLAYGFDPYVLYRLAVSYVIGPSTTQLKKTLHRS